jgi:uncharacterized protein (TIGR02594 family)
MRIDNVGTSAAATPPSRTSTTGTHRVERGDTLTDLAASYGTTVAALMKANPQVRDADRIFVGEKLNIPSGALGQGASSGSAGSSGSGASSSGGASAGGSASAGAGGGKAGWMNIARGEMGQREIAGSRDNARIVEYHDTTTLSANDDETPWCASFVNWTVEKAGFKGTDSAAAISWANWGDKVSGVGNAREGDVVVLRNKASGQEHVAFFVKGSSGSVTLLGGNQSNQVKESTYSLSNYNVVAVRRPPGAGVGDATAKPASGGSPGASGASGSSGGAAASSGPITEGDYRAAAKRLGVDVAAIKAVAEVEASGSGMLKSGKPKILFEAHVFSDQTGGKYDKSHPNLSSPSWNRSLYGAAGEHQWSRFERASALDANAAMKSASWGRFQIMGFNHKAAGYATVQDFVKGMKSGEGAQLQAFASFIGSNPKMLEALRNHDWASFARQYNGPGYAANNYDDKMAAAYAKYR